MFAPRITRSPMGKDTSSRSELDKQPSFFPARRSVAAPGGETNGRRKSSFGLVTTPGQATPLSRDRFRLIQPKLKVGAVNGPLEAEADRVAESVMSLRAADVTTSKAAPRIHRKCAECEEERSVSPAAPQIQKKCASYKEEDSASPSAPGQVHRKCAACEDEDKLLQKKPDRQPASGALGSEAPAIVYDALRSSCQPLDPKDLAFFQPRFGFDLRRVRIHADTIAAESARSIGALAYTSGSDIAFASGHYQPGTDSGRRLLAHELTHVLQQTTAETAPPRNNASAARDSYPSRFEPGPALRMAVRLKGMPGVIQRHKDDIVAYDGGQSSSMRVIQEGKLIYTAPSVSGHPDHGSNEVNVGPIPPGMYVIHPQITRPTVANIQAGVCGASEISSGYQELTSTDRSPCEGRHYCNIPCPTPDKPDQKCFTPVDCWGPMRIKIEGSQAVKSPTGARVVRNGFYIHGGNHADAVSSGCAKTLDNGIFAHIRKLTGVKGAVPFCVGDACPKAVHDAVLINDITEAASEMADSLAHSISDVLP